MGKTIKEVRCKCGKLHFIRTDKGYELKCSRCKRLFVISYEQLILDYLMLD